MQRRKRTDLGPEVILESKAEHINEDFSHEDLVGAIYAEGDLRGSDFSGSDLRAAIFSRAVMPGVNLEVSSECRR